MCQLQSFVMVYIFLFSLHKSCVLTLLGLNLTPQQLSNQMPFFYSMWGNFDRFWYTFNDNIANNEDNKPLNTIIHSVIQYKVKLFHTRYRVLGPELIPMYRQSAHRWIFKIISGGRLPLLSTRPAVTFPAEEHHRLSTGTKVILLGNLGTLVWTSFPRLSRSFVSVGIEPTTYLIASPTPYTMPLRHYSEQWVC